MTGPVVYFIQQGETGPIKIGYCDAPGSVENRRLDLQCGNPEKLYIRRVIPGSRSLEQELHRHFAQYRLEGEWFLASVEVATEAGCPDMKAGDPYRKVLPDLARTFEAGCREGSEQASREVASLIRAEVDRVLESWCVGAEPDVAAEVVRLKKEAA